MLRYGVNKCFDIMDAGLISRLREFLESEARSCSMDFGCVTPLYVYRIWGGAVALEEIETAMKICLPAGGWSVRGAEGSVARKRHCACSGDDAY